MRIPIAIIGLVALCIVASPTKAQELYTSSVSDEEVKKCVTAFISLYQVEQEAQMQMIMVVEATGIDLDRFNQIFMAQENPFLDSGITEDEQELFNVVMKDFEAIEIAAQEQMIGIIQEVGLTVERYQEIMMELEQDQELQVRFQQMMEGLMEEPMD